ncbi:hypothetical protein BGX28_009619 [Mortierella sp. GBA30]|nr:hypothetical protein BGX28_009619 [Mortierella sp. GBA30]
MRNVLYSVLTLIPSTALLIALSPRLHAALGKGRLVGIKINAAFYLKMTLVVAAFAIQLGLLVKIVSEDGYRSSSLLSTTMYLVSLASAALLHWHWHFNMPNPSPDLLLFWLLTALISIFPTRSLIEESENGLSSTIPALKLAFTVVTFSVFVLENIPKPNRSALIRPGITSPIQTNPSPELNSNFFSRMTFFWLLPLLTLGKRKTLRMEDIYSLHPKLLSYPLYLTTKANMDAHMAVMAQKIKGDGDDTKISTCDRDNENDNSNSRASKIQRGRINLAKIVLSTVGYGFMTAIIPRIFFIVTTYMRPILFSELIAFVLSYSSASKAKGVPPQEPWIGYGLLIAVFTSAALSSLFDAQFTNINFNAGLKARGVFVNLIYRKALRLSSTNKQEDMGSIVNHMSTDVDKVVAFFNIIHLSWSAVIEIIVAVAQLYGQVRYAMFASVGVIVFIVILNAVCAPRIGLHQETMMKFSDQRMKLITELVTYIKSIKLYAWESYFSEKITKARTLQLNELRKFYSWISFIVVFLDMIVPLSIFSTLSVYSVIASPEAPLDIQRIFITITLISMLDNPVNMVNSSMSAIVQGKVAYDRLQKFLNSEEIEEENVLKNMDKDASEFAYEIEHGTFGWYTPEAVEAAIEKRKKDVEDSAKEAANINKNWSSDIVDADDKSLSTFDEKVVEEKGAKTNNETDDDNSDASITPESIRDSMGPVLRDINLRIKRGSLTAVVGRVGEGKSSLVGALLGEMHRYSGTVRSFGSLAYVAQSAWILNDTVRNNILFGKSYDKERYLNTIRACALVSDLKMLINSDKTIIGEKGINLSGGQKQRISIARAVYADADVYIFDDPLSAVDAHVDQHIFELVLMKTLAHKTRILITNGVNHLTDVDQIVVIKQGRVSQDGVYAELIQDEESDLYRLVQESRFVGTKNDSADDDGASEEEQDATDDVPGSPPFHQEGTTKDALVRPERPMKRPTFRRAKSSKAKDEDLEIDDTDEVDEEIQAEGRVGWDVYKFYISKLGTAGVVAFLIIGLSFLAIDIFTKLWLKNWGNESNLPAENRHSDRYWIVTYFAWVLSSGLTLAFMIFISMVFMARRASKELHASMLGPLIRSPMAFFDVTSSGKIVNRFAHDTTTVDLDLPMHLLGLTFNILNACNIFAFCIAATYYFAIITIPIGCLYYVLSGFYLVSSREIKRLDSAARSPMYAHFGETLSGLVTIRAFDESHRFTTQAMVLLDRSQQTNYLTNATQRWLQIMLDMMSVMILSLVALLAIVQRNTVQQGIFAIVLSEIGGLTIIMKLMMANSCQIENDVVSVERVLEYSKLPSEARDVIPDSKTDEAWPPQGEIVFQDYSTRYRDGLDLVLRNLSVTVKAGERVGIVGRTGAGKSSVTLALFRIIEAAEGSISIDGIDISTLGLHELRSRLTIIPQDPFLFGDSVRSNLDPFSRHTDSEIWAALESASLKTYISSLAEGLMTKIENGGENMSLGQRQLMSLARAMLTKNTRVLCLDEATAAIDVETDNAIQQALRREFKGCTVLTIAHRINTIMDSDRIMVLDKGGLKEYETPAKLLAEPSSIFFSLAKESGNL